MNTALKNIRRSPFQATAAILVMSFNFFIIAIFALVLAGSQAILINFETRPQIIAYLKDGAKEEKINETITQLIATAQAKNIRYVSKNEALKIYKESVGNDPLLLGTVTDLGEVTADILPASLEVSVKSNDSFSQIAKVLEQSEVVNTNPQGVKEIDYPKNIVDELTRWTKAIRTAGIALTLVLSLTSIVTTGIIISMKMVSRKTEIDTMKLIGAKNSFVIKPYLWESVIYCLSGGLVGWLASFITLLYSTPFLVSRLSGIIPLPVPLSIMLALLAAVLLLSAVVGVFSGFFAVARFLRR